MVGRWRSRTHLWFTEALSDKIGRITIAGVITEFPVPTAGSTPAGITTGPDGALWFTEVSSGKIGRLALTTVNSHDFNANGKSYIAAPTAAATRRYG